MKRLCVVGLSLVMSAQLTAQVRTRHPEPPGSISVGPYSAEAFGVSARTRFAELALASIPDAVLEAVSAGEAVYGYDSYCTRYFDAGSAVLVSAPAYCTYRVTEGIQAPGPDHSALAAFRVDGVMIGTPFSDYMDSELAIEPWFRFLRSDTLARRPAGPGGETAYEVVASLWEAMAGQGVELPDGELSDSVRLWAEMKEARIRGFFRRTAGCLGHWTSHDDEGGGSVHVRFWAPDPMAEQTDRRIEFAPFRAQVLLTMMGWEVVRLEDGHGGMRQTGENHQVCQ